MLGKSVLAECVWGEPVVETWDDSTSGDYLWSAGNVREAIPGVMTPCTWSVVQRYITESAGPQIQAGHPLFGNIRGRLYMNLSVSSTVARKLGAGWIIEEMSRQAFGPVPDDLEIPEAPMTRVDALRSIGLYQLKVRTWILANAWRFRSMLDDLRRDCLRLLDDIPEANTERELVDLWSSRIEPTFARACRMIRFTVPAWMNMAVHHRIIRALVGEARGNVLTTGTNLRGHLASLDLVLGLDQLRDGAIDEAEFAQLCGHRGVNEHELSEPRPGEDPAWIERLRSTGANAPAAADVLAGQAHKRAEMWRAIKAQSRFRYLAARFQARSWARAAQRREATRHECTRIFWALRSFVERAGVVTNHGDALYMLTIDEILDVLRGDEAPLRLVPERRETYEHYREAAPPPFVFRGSVAPSPQRAAEPGARDSITGSPGAPGLISGTARVVADLADAAELRPGEILVTPFTNVGWTPFFADVAAIITDIGAPLSHAAIVAREFGIPAVVGCGTATHAICTGDQLTVNGETGTVTITRAPNQTT